MRSVQVAPSVRSPSDSLVWCLSSGSGSWFRTEVTSIVVRLTSSCPSNANRRQRHAPPSGAATVAALARDVRKRGQVVADRVGGVQRRGASATPAAAAPGRRPPAGSSRRRRGRVRRRRRRAGRGSRGAFSRDGFSDVAFSGAFTAGAASSRGASSPAARATFACASVTISGTAKSASLPDNGLNPRVPRSGSTSQVLVPTRQKSGLPARLKSCNSLHMSLVRRLALVFPCRSRRSRRSLAAACAPRSCSRAARRCPCRRQPARPASPRPEDFRRMP